MRARRRRPLLAGAVCLAVCAAFAGVSAPAAHAAAPLAGSARHDAASAGAELDGTVLRPSIQLRAPGELGLIVAHRGDSSSAPENTMPAFASTGDGRAEYIEIDIRLSHDGVPVVIHDDTVDRTTDGTGAVADLTAAQLRVLDAGSWFAEDFVGTSIPTLAEVLSHAADTGGALVVEYKGTWDDEGIRTTVDLFDAAGVTGAVFAQSFSKKTVARLARARAGFLIGWLTDRIDRAAVTTAQKIGADAVNPAHATPLGVALAHEAGLGVFSWTHDEESAGAALTAMGVDGIVTNRPAALREWMRGYDEGPRGGAQGPSSTA